MTVRPSDGSLLVIESCCVPDYDDGHRRQLLVDPDAGDIVEEFSLEPGHTIIDFDQTGAFPLVAGEPTTECDHVCPSTLYRQDGARFVLLDRAVESAAWS
jgi:hypothetical protein